MSFFQIDKTKLHRIEQKGGFPTEKVLQNLIEGNLDVTFGCRFVATEFSTGEIHAGRIDTLALSEENHPVIIEYKNKKSSDLITQSLYYLHWLNDHKGDFEIAAREELGDRIKCDWSDIRVICIAQDYSKFDTHAVQTMDANIELWKYRLYDNDTIYMQEVFLKGKTISSKKFFPQGYTQLLPEQGGAAVENDRVRYTYEDHLVGRDEKIINLMNNVREFVMGLDATKEVPAKVVVAYRTSKTILSLKAQKNKIVIFLPLDKHEVREPPGCYRDVTKTGHHGVGNSEFNISNEVDLEATKPFIEQAYNKIGG